MNELIIGGSKGLGLDIAQIDSDRYDVIITGREDPNVDLAEFQKFELSDEPLAKRIGEYVATLPHINSLVYSAGFFQEGHIDELTDDQVDDMLNVCQRGLVFFVKKLLEKQNELDELTVVTSTSQWTPRELEPVYNAAKAGAAHFSNGISQDPRVGKVLVVGPSGMNTPYWRSSGKDTSGMMPSMLAAEQIAHLRDGDFASLPLYDTQAEQLTSDYAYCFAKILRAGNDLPQRVVIEETRN